MGLTVHSLGVLTIEANKDYYIYVLDHGWHEPLGEALRKNFDRMAQYASKSNSVVIKGVESNHFEDEVFSYYSINGESGHKILPAIMISTLHPHYFKEHNHRWKSKKELQDKLLLIPLKQCCKTSTEVVELIETIFSDIKDKKGLVNFEVAKQIHQDKHWSVFTEGLVLQPNFFGMGVNFNKIIEFFKPN